MHMEASWENSPKEILHQIFQYLSDHERMLHQLQLTCKNWSQVAQELLYQKICYFEDAQKASLLLRTLASPNKSIAHVVKEIIVEEDHLQIHSNLFTFMRLCPNLKIVKQTINSSANYFPHMLKLHQEGYLQNLEEVDAPSRLNYYQEIRDYNKLMLASIKSITCLKCFEEPSTRGIFPLADCLAEFTHLRKLEITVKDDVSLFEISKFIQGNHLSFLKSIYLSTEYYIVDRHLAASNFPSNNVHALPQVEKVSLELQIFLTEYIQLITLLFPNLKNLSLRIENATDEVLNRTRAAEDKNSKIAFHDFFQYLSQTESFNLDRFAMSPQLTLDSFTSLTKFFHVRSISIEATYTGITEYGVSIYKPKQSNHDGKNKPYCHFNYQMDLNELSEATYQRLFEAIASETKLSALKIDGGGIPDEQKMNNFSTYFDSIITNCQCLIDVELRYLILNSLPNTVISTRAKLNSLFLCFCEIGPNTLLHISQRISYISNFTIFQEEGTSIMDIRKIDMPYTNFKTLKIAHDEIESYIVKISSISGITFLSVALKSGVKCLPNVPNLHLKFEEWSTMMPTVSIHCMSMVEFASPHGSIKL